MTGNSRTRQDRKTAVPAMTGRRALASVVFAACLAVCPWVQGESAAGFDQYGGLAGLQFGPGKCFRTHHDGERWWLVTPDGGAFLSLGVCNVNPVGDTDRVTGHQLYRENVLEIHGTVANWTAVTRNRLKEWGVNTLGAWSSGELRGAVPYTVELSLGAGLWGGGKVPDFFSPEAEAHLRSRAAAAAGYADDPWLLGYYLDNELPWSYDWRFMPDLFPGYVAMPPEAPGKQKLAAFLRERHGTVERLAAVWAPAFANWEEMAEARFLAPRDRRAARGDMEAFMLLVARQYFKTTTGAVRAADPNHLILGCRFVWALAPRPVVQACGEYCDVVSLNYYEVAGVGNALLLLSAGDAFRVPTELDFRAFHEITKKPLMVTEFGFRGMDSGMPNTFPPGWLLQPTVPTQRDRADKFEHCAVTWMSQPYFLGYHWFEFVDEPKGGRFDGENGNYGVVNEKDEPYTELVERFKAVNSRVWELHAASGR